MGKRKNTNTKPSSRTKRSKTSIQSNSRLPKGLEENIVFNCGDENSIYRALEDAGAGIRWDDIRNVYDSKRGISYDHDKIKIFLEEFAKDNNLTITYHYAFDDYKSWEILGNSSKKQLKKIAIRQEKRGGHEFTAVFSTQVPALLLVFLQNVNFFVLIQRVQRLRKLLLCAQRQLQSSLAIGHLEILSAVKNMLTFLKINGTKLF